MNHRLLGRTGLNVSALSFGTVSLGVDYGIAAPGEFGRPDERRAIAVLEEARDRGITLFDTAPAYGESERLLGRALGGDSQAIFATKTGPIDVEISLNASRRALRRDTIDVVQIHNATAAMIQEGRVVDVLEEARARGAFRFLGASVYGEEAALAAIRSRRFDVLQVAYSLLDQRMAARVIPEAAAAGVGVLVRSALLKGALTPKAQWLPAALESLRAQSVRARDTLANGKWEDLPSAAMRFCLSTAGVSSVLTGARTSAELDAALAAEREGPLDVSLEATARALGLTSDELLNPSYWPVP